jgi:SNF2 family DNA or RNA helicase
MELYKHQIESIKRALRTDGNHALFQDVGIGKTITALMIYRNLRDRTPNLKMIVVCPKRLINTTWKDEIAKTPYKWLAIREIKQGRAIPDVDIFIINYESLISAKQLELTNKILNTHPCMVTLDESSRMRCERSKTSKTLLALRDKIKHRLIMTATPAPNDEAEYWAQIAFVDPTIFPDNFFKFRYKYFNLMRGGYEVNMEGGLSRSELSGLIKKGFRFTLKNALRQEFYEKIKQIAYFVKKEDVLDLPEQMDEYAEVELTDSQRRMYNDMKYRLITEINEKNIVAQTALTKLMRLRQICSGFSRSDEGTSERTDNPKLRILEETLDELGKHQVMIFCQFHEEIQDVKKLLGDKAATLYSETEDQDESVKGFQEAKYQYLIAHPRSGGVGLSFNNCDYMVFYGLSYSFEEYYQSRGRIHRAGKKNKATYIHLIAKDTIEELVLKVVQRKGDAYELVREFCKGGR